MKSVITLAQEEVERGGLPFAAIILNPDHELVAEAVNTVRLSHDPTDHAEIRALRAATQKLGKSELQHYQVYVIGHPCPMCMAALALAKPEKIYFAVGSDTKNRLLGDVNKGVTFLEDHLPIEHLREEEDHAVAVFKEWSRKHNEQR